jgi:hypothetical protein
MIISRAKREALCLDRISRRFPEGSGRDAQIMICSPGSAWNTRPE